VAALTSTVSLLEVVTSSLVDEWRLSRRTAAVSATVGITLLGVPSALSLGGVGWLSKLYTVDDKPQGFLDLMNFIFGNIALAVGALLICLFVMLRWKPDQAIAEIAAGAAWFQRIRRLWVFALAVLCPLAVLSLLVYMVVTGKALG
jgi:NSS family neurotransmitter:Na+ symporter